MAQAVDLLCAALAKGSPVEPALARIESGGLDAALVDSDKLRMLVKKRITAEPPDDSVCEWLFNWFQPCEK